MPSSTVHRSFSFVDLAGFTALTEAHGDDQAADLIAHFVAIAEQACRAGDRVVKSIGDAVMLVSESPSDAIGAVGRIAQSCAADPSFPAPRSGIHHGAAAERAGDFFGAAVNLAARVAGHASGGQTLATSEVAAAARDLGIDVSPIGSARLRNIAEPVELYDLAVCQTEPDWVIDPVCRMQFAAASAAGYLRHDDTDHWFCSLKCAGMFAAQPDSYRP